MATWLHAKLKKAIKLAEIQGDQKKKEKLILELKMVKAALAEYIVQCKKEIDEYKNEQITYTFLFTGSYK